MPFTLKQFLNVFKEYNEQVFPLQFLLVFLALLAVYMVINKTLYSGKIINLILAFFWIWMGIVYHIVYFSKINKAAYIFGGLFILQGLQFVVSGVFKDRLQYSLRTDKKGFLAILLIAFSIIGYPLLGYYIGHTYPFAPTFGLPCPTVIFTFGILLLVNTRNNYKILVIPILWSIIGTFAIFQFGMSEDSGLTLSGIITIVFWFIQNRQNHEKMV